VYTLISAFFCAFIFAALLIRHRNLHQHVTGDIDLTGPQKFHASTVPRIGGLPIFIALIGASLIRLIQDASSGEFIGMLILAATPAFLVGFAEDISKRVGILIRLFGTALSAYLIGFAFDSWIMQIDLWGIDFLLALPFIYISFTIIALSGIANAYNIIDGFNGLASMVGIITLLAISYVCFRVGDITLLIAALAMIGAIGGFFFWNYPRGLIFLGDGGAYLIGIWIGALSILLVTRNPLVSPWFALLVNAYPIFETLFSMWRRKVHQGKNPGMPDGAHFHTLIYRRIMRWTLANHTAATGGATHHRPNARTSPYLWLLSSLAVIPALLFWQYSWILQAFSLLFCISYVWLYRSIVRFQTPSWLKMK
jgi:UDP-GlcNAc:undecaprenyl-phosphate/decaprenyl-phosphate GlcNAc-1-phosphate transferase